MCAIGRALMSRSQAAAARRAVGRPGAGRRPAGLRAGEAHPRRRPHRADRRAERAAGAARRRPRLPARGRQPSAPPARRPSCWRATRSNRRISASRAGARWLEIFDIYLLEAMVNGILLGGVLALLALGLNLIFGVIDVTWICYAELVMIGMYGMYYLCSVYGLPYWVAAPVCIALVAVLGAAAALPRDRAAARRAADQPAAGHRRRAVRPAELRHRGVRHRLPQSRHPPAGAGARRDALQLRPPARLRRGAGRHGGGLSLHDADLHRHGDPRHRAGPPDHGADGRRHAAASTSSPRRSAARWPASRPACWSCSTTSIPSSACRSARSPS